MRKIIIILATIAYCVAVPSVVQAHVLRTDGSTGAVLHILPDDAPVTNTPTPVELQFQGSDGTFSLANCDCKIDYMLNGESIMTQNLIAESTASSRNIVTFEKAGVYTFRVTGAPKDGATFASFTLDYPVRVSGGQAGTQPIPLTLWLGIGMGAVLVLLYANTQQGGTRRMKEEE